MLARLGGDEFAALIPIVQVRAAIEEVSKRLERCFDAPFAVEGYVLRGAASVGFALFPEDGTTGDSLLGAADAAMMRMASKSVIGLVSSNGFDRNKATLLGGPCGTRRGISPGILLRVLPSRVAAVTAFKKDTENSSVSALGALPFPRFLRKGQEPTT